MTKESSSAFGADDDVTFTFKGVEVTARASSSERAALFVKADADVLTTLFEAFKQELADGGKKKYNGPVYSMGGFKVYIETSLDIRILVVVAIIQLHHCYSEQCSYFQFGLPHCLGRANLRESEKCYVVESPDGKYHRCSSESNAIAYISSSPSSAEGPE